VKARLSILDQCRLLVRAASWIVPRRSRAEWRREWEAELESSWHPAQQGGKREPEGLRRRCCGAFLDAAWHRCNQGDLRRAGRHWSQTPASLLFLLSLALLLLVAASDDLRRMQAILLKPPYNDPERIATISRTGVISSAEWVIPYSWVRVWRGGEPGLEGVAAYSSKSRQVVVVAGRHRATIRSVRVEDSLFQVFGVRLWLGRTPQPGDAQTCPNCVVLSSAVWRRYFRSDPSIVRKKLTIDGQEAIVAGVLPERFWFPSSSVGVWSLADPASFSGEGVGIVARLRAGASGRSAEWSLQRDIANATGEAFWGSMLEVWPVEERIRQPLNSYFDGAGDLGADHEHGDLVGANESAPASCGRRGLPMVELSCRQMFSAPFDPARHCGGVDAGALYFSSRNEHAAGRVGIALGFFRWFDPCAVVGVC
jgi:hypothetical protein